MRREGKGASNGDVTRRVRILLVVPNRDSLDVPLTNKSECCLTDVPPSC